MTSVIQGVVFFLYLLAMILIGFCFYKKNSSHSDYVLGGRGMNVWVTSMSAQASDMSGWLLMGLPGLAYLVSGVTEAIWTAIGLAIGTYLNWLIVAKPLRKYTQIANNSLTIPDFLKNRFKEKSEFLRIICALFIVIFFTVYTASMFAAGAKLFDFVFGIDYSTALIISVLVVTIYTFLGGFKAVCWTDLVQGLLMFFAIIIVPFAMLRTLNGDAISVSQAFENITIMPTENFGVMGIIGAIAWGLGYFGQPHILARFMAIKSSKEVRPARIIAMVWVILTLAAAVIIGIIARPYIAAIAGKGLITNPTISALIENGAISAGNQEKVFMILVQQMFPAIIAGVLLSAVLAAIMSTADSQLLVTASAVSGDLYKPLFKKNATDKELVFVSRIAIAAVAIVAGIIAIDPESSVFEIVSHAWAGFGAAFGPIILCSLFWKNTNAKGAAAGVISGGVVALVWAYMGNILGWFGITELPAIFSLYEIVPGFIISLLFIFIVSKATGGASKEVIEEFESVKTADI